MKKLTSIEWARAKEPILHLSVASRAPGQRQEMADWLAARAGGGWYYFTSDNYHFGPQVDATAFRQWLFAALAEA